MAASRHPVPPSSTVSIPRSWLIGLVAIFITPWLIFAAIYARGASAEETGSPAATTPRPSKTGAMGPWGRITTSPILVSPPLEYIPAEEPAREPVVWYLPNTSPDVAATFLAWTGMPQADAARILATARQDPSTNGIALFPDAATIRGFSADVRARLYLKLAKSRMNRAQAESYRFLGSSPSDWFDGSPVSSATRAIVEPLIYRDGPFLHFADLETARPEITDPAEWRLLRKALMRSSTVVAKLTVERPSEVAQLAQYWGAGGRRLDIRPLIESVAGGGPDHSIDVIHLLPSLARNHLYRYPKLTAADLDKSILANCLWTALNFFALEPNDRFLDVETSLNTLKNDYYIVEDGFQLGDVVAFLDENGTLYHAAVYLADGLAFTKNGTSPMAPWTIMSVDNIRAFYNVRAENARLIYHRRKDL